MEKTARIEKTTPSETACAHCGEPCLEASFKLADKSFCCIGCKTVYEILDENSLCSFYSLDSKAGLSQKKAKDPRAYAYLDDPEAREKLLEFDDGQSALVSFYLPQIHCISCIWLLEHLYKLDAGIAHSRVNFLKKTVSIQFNPSETSLRKIAAMLSSIGYGPTCKERIKRENQTTKQKKVK